MLLNVSVPLGPQCTDPLTKMPRSSNNLWVLEHDSEFTQMASTAATCESSRAPLRCGGTENSRNKCSWKEAAGTVWCIKICEECFQHPAISCSHEALSWVWRQTKDPGEVYPMNCLVVTRFLVYKQHLSQSSLLWGFTIAIWDRKLTSHH